MDSSHQYEEKEGELKEAEKKEEVHIIVNLNKESLSMNKVVRILKRIKLKI